MNSTSVLIAAKSAVEGFKTLPSATKKTFIFTGNALAVMALPPLLTFGMAKSAGAHLIMSAAKAYKGHGYRSVLQSLDKLLLRARTYYLQVLLW